MRLIQEGKRATETYTVSRKLLVLGIPITCAILSVVLLFLQRVAASTSDPTYELFHASASFSALVGVALLSCLALIWRYERPLVVLAVELLLTFIAGFMGVDSFFSIQLLVAYYTVAVMATLEVTIGTGILSVAVMLAPVVITNPVHPLIESLPRALPVAVIGAIGIAVRLTREAREARQRQEVEEQRALILEAQRDAAVRRSEIAGELHDSVGHGLTTIISLSQGLAVQLEGTIDDPAATEALNALTTIARESLEDTRTALRNLTSAETSLGVDTETKPLHTWDDIRPVLENARKLGIVVTLIETGRRVGDAVQGDLCFRITREAVTNALRHGSDLHIISVNWNHNDDESVDIEVTNDGETIKDAAALSPGTGLNRLAGTLRSVGGTFNSGITNETDTAWRVIATIPPTDRAGMSND